MGNGHSRFGPSSSSRWITCPGSVLHQNYNDSGSKYAAEGTMMHEVAEKCLVNPDLEAEHFLNQDFVIDGFKFSFDHEHVEAVRFYLDAIWNLKEDYPDGQMYVEQQVSLSAYGEEYSTIFGTADCIIDDPFNVLLVIDLKGGKGVSVSADSPQPKLYGLMAAGKMLETYEKIYTIIIQPRDQTGAFYKLAEHEPEDLLKWWEEEVKPAIDNGRSDNPTYCPSESACRWCYISGNCSYQTEKVYSTGVGRTCAIDDFMDIDASNDFRPPGKLTNEELGKALDEAKFINDWLGAINLVALQRMQKGEVVPGHKIVEKGTKRKWDPDQDVEEFLKTRVHLTVDEIYKKVIQTPLQILKLVPEKHKEAVESFIIKPKGAPTVAPVYDKRPALEPTEPDGEDDFEDVPGDVDPGGLFD